MNRVAFIFSSAPHGNSSGREGLDVLLSMSALSKEIGVFFISDGVFQIISRQYPNVILTRDYIATFKLLPICDIKNIWICSCSMQERGLKEDTPLVIKAKFLSTQKLYKKLSHYKIVLKF